MKTKNLLEALKRRFDENPARHRGIEWRDVEARLAAHPKKHAALAAMEQTGGEPDVIGRDPQTGELIFCDCAPETPKGRVSVCYDPEALAARNEHKPKHSAIGMARKMGVELLTEDEYRALQQLGEFDTRTSSWIKTPDDVRALGGALFGDRRYGRVFIYHNGAQSYYAARAFRARLKI